MQYDYFQSRDFCSKYPDLELALELQIEKSVYFFIICLCLESLFEILKSHTQKQPVSKPLNVMNCTYYMYM